MSNSILVGCRGWKHPLWTPGFYPEELPEDWRFCYYSNEVRSVLVPYAETLDEDPARWRNECDQGFRFVFEHELRAGVDGDSTELLGQLLTRIRPVADLTAAILLSVPRRRAFTSSELARLLETVKDVPLCMDISRMDNRKEMRAMLQRNAVGQTWYPMCDAATPVGGFQIALAERAEVPKLREILESLRNHAERGRGAALFFTQPEQAPELALRARTLAEIMGV